MGTYLNQELDSTRQINDLKIGLPAIFKLNDNYFLIFSVETLSEISFSKVSNLLSEGKGPPYIAITRNRAELLKVRVYDNDLARIQIPKKVELNWLKASADPSMDLDYPMKGPYESIREGDGKIARFSLQFCKKAELLPAALIIPIYKNIAKGLQGEGLLVQNITNISAPKITDFQPILVSSARVPLPDGFMSKVSVFRDTQSASEHYAVEVGIIDDSKPVLTRLHSSCFTGDVLHSLKCDCGDQLESAMEKIRQRGSGVILYLNQEGRGIGLANKMRAYKLQENGLDTFEANQRLGFNDDERDLALGAKILRVLGIKQIILLTNNPLKVKFMENSGVKITDRLSLITKIREENKNYLEAKQNKSGHSLTSDEF